MEEGVEETLTSSTMLAVVVNINVPRSFQPGV